MTLLLLRITPTYDDCTLHVNCIFFFTKAVSPLLMLERYEHYREVTRERAARVLVKLL